MPGEAIQPDAIMRRNVSGNTVPEAWGDDVRSAIRDIYLTTGFRSATRSVAEYQRWVGADVAVPSVSTVRTWVQRYKWGVEAREMMRAQAIQEYRADIDDLQRLSIEVLKNNMMVGLEPDANAQDRFIAQDAAKHSNRIFGWGTAGAQGGSMEQGVADDVAADDGQPKSLEKQQQELREMLAADREIANT